MSGRILHMQSNARESIVSRSRFETRGRLASLSARLEMLCSALLPAVEV